MIMIDIGPPITLPVTAAIPATANNDIFASGIKNLKKNAKIQPKAAPINKAGEKIPPKSPNLIQTTVNTTLLTSKTIKVVKVFSSTNRDLIVSEPKPRTSGTNKPTIPQIIPAIIGNKKVGIFDIILNKNNFKYQGYL